MSGKQYDDRTPPVSDELPVVPHRVIHTGIAFYRDEGCQDQVEDAHIMIVEPLDPDDAIHELDVVPTKLDYQQGQLVHFQTDHHIMWDACWFHNPVTGRIEKAWNVVAASFVGAVISQETVAKHQRHIDELDARLAKKKGATASSAPTIN